jgi:ribosomal protein L17
MKDRFDLEQEILRTTNYADDLRTVVENMLNNSIEGITNVNKYANAIEGVATLIEMQCNKMFDTMSQCFKLDNYRESA